nr:GNAT family N-acetyltransferase [Actinomycetales bacterium]
MAPTPYVPQPPQGVRSGGSKGDYPAHWEADVISRDGQMFHIRPIRPSDAAALQDLHLSQSESSRVYRFFAPRGELTEKELDQFTRVDHAERVALVVTDSAEEEEVLAFGTYDSSGPGTAEVAFYVADSAHGRGLGSILLDHLAAAAWERGLHRFEADVLPTNSRMLAVFRDAGYTLTSRLLDGVITVSLDLLPTAESRRVLAAREQHSESLSMAGVLNPAAVVTVGSSPALPRGLPAWDGSPFSVPTLALIDDDAASLSGHLTSLGLAGAWAAVVLTRVGEPGHWFRALLRSARDSDLRLVGPSSFGILTADGTNLTREPALRGGGVVSVLTHRRRSATEITDRLVAAGVPVRTFLAAGNRLDVSGNDAMQWWLSDPGTRVAAISLDSIGNPRKFARISRALALTMPVVCHIGSTTGQSAPPGHPVRTSALPRAVLSGMLRQSGVIEAGSRADLVDLACLAVGGRPAAVRLLATTPSGEEAAARALAGVAVEPHRAAEGGSGGGTPVVPALTIVVDQPLAGEVREGSAAEVARAAEGAVIAVMRHPAPVRIEGSSAVVTDDLDRAVRLATLLLAPPAADSPPAGGDVDLAAARRALAHAEPGALTEEATANLLAAYHLTARQQPGGDGWEEVLVEGTEDPLYGPVISLHHGGDAKMLGDVAYRIAPLTERDVAELLAEPRSAVQLTGRDLGPLRDVTGRLARLKDDLPEVSHVLARVLVGESSTLIVRVEVRLAGGGRLDTRGRAMAGGEFGWGMGPAE